MKKRLSKKLTLSRETIRPLADESFSHVAGGCRGPRTTFTANDCSGDNPGSAGCYTGESQQCTGGTDSGFCGPSLYCTFLQQ